MAKRINTLLGEFFNYKSFILVGLAMMFFTLLKIFGYLNFSSDWFWFIAGVGLFVEGWISFLRQKMFKQKYKIVLRETAK